VKLHFTSHNFPIVFEGTTYLPGGGPSPTALRRETGLVDQNREFRGLIDSDAITAEDLYGGRYDGARIREFVVDWRYPWEGEIQRTDYIILKVSFDGERWNADCGGPNHLLSQEKGMVVTRACRWKQFGNTSCGVNLAGNHPVDADRYLTQQGELYDTYGDRAFNLNGLDASNQDDDFNEGYIEFLTGPCIGVRMQVYDYDAAGHPTYGDDAFILYEDIPFVPNTVADDSTGDQVLCVMGCNRTWSRCSEYGNNLNYGGFRYVPGWDKSVSGDQ
jgi:uncharacterized phage protein (TIGR02218 family)